MDSQSRLIAQLVKNFGETLCKFIEEEDKRIADFKNDRYEKIEKILNSDKIIYLIQNSFRKYLEMKEKHLAKKDKSANINHNNDKDLKTKNKTQTYLKYLIDNKDILDQFPEELLKEFNNLVENTIKGSKSST